MNEQKKPEIVFMPGCFDDFEGTPEELAELIADLNRMVETGEFFENCQPATEEEVEMLEKILDQRQKRQ